MKANIKIEAIGHGNDQLFKFWGMVLDECVCRGLSKIIEMPTRYGVWKVVGDNMIEVRGRTDYSQSNSKGTRGVYINYILDGGKIYYVNNPISWKCVERFFATVDQSGNIIRHESYEDAKKATEL